MRRTFVSVAMSLIATTVLCLTTVSLYAADAPREVPIFAIGKVGEPAYGYYTAPSGKKIVGHAYKSHRGCVTVKLERLGDRTIRLTALGGGIVGTPFTGQCNIDVVEE